MMTLSNDLLPLIGFLLDNQSLRNTSQVNKELNRRIETICELFCKKKELSLNHNWLNTYCHDRNYQTWTSKSVSVFSTTYEKNISSIFLIPCEEVYNAELDVNIEEIKKVIDYNQLLLTGPWDYHIKCHENEIAGFLGPNIEVLDLKNFKRSVIELEKGIERLLFFNGQLLIVKDCEEHLVFINLETGKSITSKSTFNVDELSETKNFLVFKQCYYIGQICKTRFSQISKQSGAVMEICNCRANAKMSTNKDYLGLVSDGKLSVYRDTEADKLIWSFEITIPNFDFERHTFFSSLKFFQGLLFYKYQESLIIIDPSKGKIISSLNNIKGKGAFTLKNNQFITKDPLLVWGPSSVTYHTYSFNS